MNSRFASTTHTHTGLKRRLWCTGILLEDQAEKVLRGLPSAHFFSACGIWAFPRFEASSQESVFWHSSDMKCENHFVDSILRKGDSFD